MLRGTYSGVGNDARLRFKEALLRMDPDDPDNYLAQFDALYLPESRGWHAFPRDFFVNVEGEE